MRADRSHWILGWMSVVLLGISTGISKAQVSCPTWRDYGQGLAGTAGIPALVGSGNLTAGASVTLTVSGGRPSAFAFLVVGAAPLGARFCGGVMVPFPTRLIPITLNGAGSVSLTGPWPAGIPAGSTFFYQAWIFDPAGVAGCSATNAVAGTTPDPAGTLTQVQVLGDTFASDPVPGIRVLRHHATSGALLAERTTDVGGYADFGPTGSLRSSITLVGPTNPADGTLDLISLLNMPAGCTPLGAVIPSSVHATFNLRMTGLPATADENVLLIGGHVESERAFAPPPAGGSSTIAGVPVQQLQPGGRFSLLSFARDTTTGLIQSYGHALDLLPSAVNGTTVTLPTTLPPVLVPYTSTGGIPLYPGEVDLRRNGAYFEVPVGRAFAASSGNFQVCDLPGTNCYTFTAVFDVSLDPYRRGVEQVHGSLPGSLNFSAPSLFVQNVSRSPSGTTVSWNQSGSEASGADLLAIELVWRSASGQESSWQVWQPAGATSLTLPALPADLAAKGPPAQGVSVEVRLMSISPLSGYDAIFQGLIANGGSVVELFCSQTESRLSASAEVAVTVSVSGGGSGHVISTPAGINTSLAQNTACFRTGTVVTLTAVPGPGETASWLLCPEGGSVIGNQCTFEVRGGGRVLQPQVDIR